MTTANALADRNARHAEAFATMLDAMTTATGLSPRRSGGGIASALASSYWARPQATHIRLADHCMYEVCVEVLVLCDAESGTGSAAERFLVASADVTAAAAANIARMAERRATNPAAWDRVRRAIRKSAAQDDAIATIAECERALASIHPNDRQRRQPLLNRIAFAKENLA